MAETRPTDAPDTGPFDGDLDQPVAMPPAGNRPAAGAREVHGHEPVPTHWQGAQGATDFLGLDPEVRASAPESAAQDATDPSAGPTDSWLFDIERAGEAAPVAAVPGSEDDGPTAPLDLDGDPASGPGELEPEPFDELLDAVDEAASDPGESDTAFGAPPRPARSTSPAIRRWLRAALLLATLAAVGSGGWFAWQRYGPRTPESARTAVVSNRPAKPAPRPAAAGPLAVPGSPDEPPTPAIAGTDVLDGEHAVSDALAGSTDDPAAEPITIPTPAPEPVELVESTPAPQPPPEAPAPTLVRAPGETQRTTPPPIDDIGPGGSRRATARDLAGMWLGTEIPKDAIDGPSPLRTLNVGRVRASLMHGEHIEGTLHAVGQGRIWLEVPLGRMSFESGDVRSLVQITGGSGPNASAGIQSLAGLARVEVLLPGGALRGRLLARDGARVTLVTDDGMRVEVEALDVRPAPVGGTRLIGPVAKAGL